jgi:hypothetical protein
MVITTVSIRTHFVALLVIGLVQACAAAPKGAARSEPTRLKLTFSAEADSFRGAVHEYDSLWTQDGVRITRALETAAHLRFAEIGDTVIRAIVFEGGSSSGYRESPMRMRASYPLATKRATLMHELGHRLQSDLFRASENDHPFLFLWLYAAWVDAYGEDFAREQVAVEKRRRGPMDYAAAWDEALGLSPEARAARWDSVRSSRIHR